MIYFIIHIYVFKWTQIFSHIIGRHCKMCIRRKRCKLFLETFILVTLHGWTDWWNMKSINLQAFVGQSSSVKCFLIVWLHLKCRVAVLFGLLKTFQLEIAQRSEKHNTVFLSAIPDFSLTGCFMLPLSELIADWIGLLEQVSSQHFLESYWR